MAIDITALYCCLDDFCKVFEDWEAHRLIPSQTTRQRTGKLSRSEMLLIIVLFQLSPFKHFKVFYHYGIGQQHRALTVMSERGRTRSRAPGANSNAAIAANNNITPAIALQRVTRSTLMPASHGSGKYRNAFEVPTPELVSVLQSKTCSR
jgi:hypothetical protein